MLFDLPLCWIFPWKTKDKLQHKGSVPAFTQLKQEEAMCQTLFPHWYAFTPYHRGNKAVQNVFSSFN